MATRHRAPLYEVTAQIAADSHHGGSCKGKPGTGALTASPVGEPRGCVDADRDAIDYGMDEAYSLVSWTNC